MKLHIVWTNDCQGKKDYDGDIVAVSTRYWPGPITVFDSAHREKGLHQIDGGPPSATCTIRLLNGCHNDESVTLIGKDFEGKTFEEVARKVERWAQTQMNRVEKALRAEFKGRK